LFALKEKKLTSSGTEKYQNGLPKAGNGGFMKTKNTFILLILVLVLGFTNSPGIGKNPGNQDRILESKLNFGNDSDLSCKLQTKSSSVRQTSGGNLTVSINSNWICR
jgi:hypothetical protein